MTSETVEDGPAAAARAIIHMGGKPPESEPLPCPRCQSTNTKFCYYNNYNLSQPRYFCKSCRRYWTRGGTLRNVPVGGGTRKSSSLKRSRSTATTTSSVAPSSSSSSTLTYDPAPADALSALPGSTPETGKIQDLNQAISMPAEPVYTVPGFLSEMGHGVKIQDLNQTIPGGFTSLLETQQMSGFGSFGGFGLEPGSGIRGMGFSLAPWGWPMVETGGGNDGEGGSDGMVGSGGGVSGCNTWQVSGVEGGGIGDGDCFGWPDLAISTPSNGGVS